MIKRQYTNWTINDDTKGLLFFAQRLDEALFDYTAEKYKASVLYTPSSCNEVLETISQYKDGIWPFKTLETVYSEFKQIYKKDDTAKFLVGEIDSYYIINIDEHNIDNLKSNLELLYLKITPKKYFGKVKDQLLSEVSNEKRNIEIEKLTLRFIAVLTHIGYSQEYIYFQTNEFFFKSNRIDNVDILNKYFEIFNLEIQRYDVYLKANSLFDKIKDACSRFETEIVTEIILTPSNIKKLKIQSSEYLIKVSNVNTLDSQRAKVIAEKTLSKIGDLFTFFHHKQRLLWGKDAIVFNSKTKNEVFLRGNISPMHKGFDCYPNLAAERLDKMLREFDLQKDSFFRFNRSIDFHGTAIDNKYPENQLLQNWIAIETLIVENKEDSKINQILSALVPILNFEYIKRIFIELATDIERLKDTRIINLLNRVPEGSDLYEKLAALVTIHTNLALAQELFSLQSDFPLLNYRIFWLNKHLSNSSKVIDFIQNHTQRVEWHIRRIYRARNLIIHTGKVPNSIDRLVESSHSYLDDLANVIMNLSINGRQIKTIEHGIKEIKLRNKMHVDYLNDNINAECVSDNYTRILWGKK